MKIVFLIVFLRFFCDPCVSQSNWIYINDTSIPNFFVSSIDAPNGDLIVLESNETENPQFKRQCNLRRFSSNGKPKDYIEVVMPDLSIYGSDLLKHESYFLFVGMILHSKDSFRTDLLVRRYDYALNLLQENIYSSTGFQPFSMRTQLINDSYYVSSIYTNNRITHEAIQNIFKLDTLGNLILKNYFNYLHYGIK